MINIDERLDSILKERDHTVKNYNVVAFTLIYRCIEGLYHALQVDPGDIKLYDIFKTENGYTVHVVLKADSLAVDVKAGEDLILEFPTSVVNSNDVEVAKEFILGALTNITEAEPSRTLH